MKKREIDFYEKIGNWDFSDIKYQTERKTKWDFYEEIGKRVNEKSLCLDIGTGGGEKVLKYYPKVGMIIATDNSGEMLKTARKNLKNYPDKRVKFTKMNNLEMIFQNEMFDLISARHTIIDAKQCFDRLVDGGAIVIEGVNKEDCIELKEMFGRGQGFKDKISIGQKDYEDLVNVGFSKVEFIDIYEDEFYETEEDLMALLLKTPIINDFSEIEEKSIRQRTIIEKELFNDYVQKFKTEKGILLRRKLYGIVAIK